MPRPDAVLRILNTAWDPIGLNGLKSFDPETGQEYVGYALEITSMLDHGADADRVVEYLRWAEDYMGLDPSIERIKRVADMLLQFRGHNWSAPLE